MKGLHAVDAPLVGREAEFHQILAGIEGGSPVAFVLSGVAGIGKTRLAASVAEAAEKLGFVTVYAMATQSAASIPFGPFAPFLPVDHPVAGDLLGLLRYTTKALLDRGGEHGHLLLVVDDAHLLDDCSAALVHQLVQTASCSLLMTVRVPSSPPDPVSALWKNDMAARIALDPLTEPEVERVAAGILGAPVAGPAVRRLWELSSGNVLYLRELLAGAVESGALIEDSGIWSLRGPMTPPDHLVELVAARIADLSPDTTAVIELLAIAEPVGLPLLEVLTDAAAVEDAERQGFVAVYQEGRRTEVRLGHPIYGEALRHTLPRSGLRRLSASLAAAVEETGARRREDLLRLACWRLDSGGRADPDLLGRAARLALSMFDMKMGIRLAGAALDSGGGVEAGLVLGEAQMRSGQHEEAEALFSRLVPLCKNDTEVALVANIRAHNRSNYLGDSSAAVAVLDEALSTVVDVPARLRLLGRLADNRFFEGDPEGALDAAAPLLASDEDFFVIRGTFAASNAQVQLGRSDQAVASAYRGLEAHRRLDEMKQLPEHFLIPVVLAHASAGRFDEAEAVGATGYKACLAANDTECLATFDAVIGQVLVERGQLAAASRSFREGASLSRRIGDVAAVRFCVGGIALAEAMAGRSAQSSAAREELEDLPARKTLFEPELIDRALAWTNVATGEISAARAILKEGSEGARARHQWLAEARLLHDIARLGDPKTVCRRLAELGDTIDGPFVDALAAHAGALARPCGADLEAAGRRFDEYGANLLAAEAYLAAAHQLRREGLLRHASATLRRSGELAAACGDVRTPGLSLKEDIKRLTQRESEIANLAAAGASSREIAAALFLSVRTVDNHLQRVYHKLGVGCREELSKVVHGTG